MPGRAAFRRVHEAAILDARAVLHVAARQGLTRSGVPGAATLDASAVVHVALENFVALRAEQRATVLDAGAEEALLRAPQI